MIVPVMVAGFINMRALGDDVTPRWRASRSTLAVTGLCFPKGRRCWCWRSTTGSNRGAHIYAEVAGYGSTNDAYHMAAQLETGDGAARTMQRALNKAGITADQMRLYQRARHVHPYQRPGGDAGYQEDVRRGGLQGGYLVHQEHNRAHDGRVGRAGGDGVRSRHTRQPHTANHQLRGARSGLRSRLHAQPRTGAAGGICNV